MKPNVTVRRPLARILAFVDDKKDGGVVYLAAGLLFALAPLLLQDAITSLSLTVRIPEYILHGTAIFLALVLLGTYIFRNRKKIFIGEILPPPEELEASLEKLRVEVITNLQDLKTIQEVVVREIFGEETPPNEEVYEMYKGNTKSSNAQFTIALFSEDENRYVGFASIWPLTDDAANRLLAGEINENELRHSDILPYSQKDQAKFVIVPGIGVVPAKTKIMRIRGATLMRRFKRFIAEEYFASSDGTLTLVATGYSGSGDKWCKRLGMAFKRMSNFGDGEHHPLYEKKFSRNDLDSWIKIVNGS